MTALIRLALGAAVALALTPAALAQHPVPAAKPAAAPAGRTVSLQGPSEQAAWVNNPYMRKFYDASKAAFAKGPDKVDVPAFEETSRQIFTEFAKSMGGDPAAMLDHLKLIPRQVVQITKEDPTVLDSYDNFMLAMMGPK